MTRLKIILKYTNIKYKKTNPKMYLKAQSLKQRILKKQDKKIIMWSSFL